MNMNNRYLKIAGIVVGAAALLYYPALRIYKMMQARKSQEGNNEEHKTVKSFAPSYRGHHKPHHRKAETNGHLVQG